MNGQAAWDNVPAIVALPAEIDLTNANDVYERLWRAVASGAPVIIADLTGTEFCDAGGVRGLVKMREEAATRGLELRLVIPPGALMRRVLVLLGFDHLLPVYASIREAGEPLAASADPLAAWRAPPAWWREDSPLPRRTASPLHDQGRLRCPPRSWAARHLPEASQVKRRVSGVAAAQEILDA